MFEQLLKKDPTVSATATEPPGETSTAKNTLEGTARTG
jgi:hypothetical protein